jgi:hypothetical protein
MSHCLLRKQLAAPLEVKDGKAGAFKRQKRNNTGGWVERGFVMALHIGASSERFSHKGGDTVGAKAC